MAAPTPGQKWVHRGNIKIVHRGKKKIVPPPFGLYVSVGQKLVHRGKKKCGIPPFGFYVGQNWVHCGKKKLWAHPPLLGPKVGPPWQKIVGYQPPKVGPPWGGGKEPRGCPWAFSGVKSGVPWQKKSWRCPPPLLGLLRTLKWGGDAETKVMM